MNDLGLPLHGPTPSWYVSVFDIILRWLIDNGADYRVALFWGPCDPSRPEDGVFLVEFLTDHPRTSEFEPSTDVTRTLILPEYSKLCWNTAIPETVHRVLLWLELSRRLKRFQESEMASSDKRLMMFLVQTLCTRHHQLLLCSTRS